MDILARFDAVVAQTAARWAAEREWVRATVSSPKVLEASLERIRELEIKGAQFDARLRRIFEGMASSITGDFAEDAPPSACSQDPADPATRD